MDMGLNRSVTVISHGPNCLDGLTCAVVAARYFAGHALEVIFASNRRIDEILGNYNPDEPDEAELWITDISWHEEATTRHLADLLDRGAELYWIDHHKSAIEARERGLLDIDFTDAVIDARYAASRLLFDYLCERTARQGQSKPGLLALRNLVMLADDVDRWELVIEGSRELALAVRAMDQDAAYRALLAMDSNITYGQELQRAAARVQGELAATFDLARATRCVEEVTSRHLTVVAAECEGYAGEVADRWREDFGDAVFALYDRRGDGISFRRTPDCPVDLSRLASSFGGGGHAAAAGCEISLQAPERAARLVDLVAGALRKEADR